MAIACYLVQLNLSCQGCVYLKMDSLKSAMGAYKALHGGWYKGESDATVGWGCHHLDTMWEVLCWIRLVSLVQWD